MDRHHQRDVEGAGAHEEEGQARAHGAVHDLRAGLDARVPDPLQVAQGKVWEPLGRVPVEASRVHVHHVVDRGADLRVQLVLDRHHRHLVPLLFQQLKVALEPGRHPVHPRRQAMAVDQHAHRARRQLRVRIVNWCGGENTPSVRRASPAAHCLGLGLPCLLGEFPVFDDGALWGKILKK